MDDVDLLALCCAQAGERSANVAAHVSRLWRDAVGSVWRDGWQSDAEAVLASAERLAWAESVGCPPSRGRPLLRRAARVGALDVLHVVAPQYAEWDAGATIAAATADQLEVLLAHDPSPDPDLLYGAGPRVRGYYEGRLTGTDGVPTDGVPMRPMIPRFFDRKRDFRNLLRSAETITPVLEAAALEVVRRVAHLHAPLEQPIGGWWTRDDVDRLSGELGPTHAPVQVHARHTQPSRPGNRVTIRLPEWTIVSDVRVTGGRILHVSLGGTDYEFEATRSWFVRPTQFHRMDLWIEAEAATLEMTYTGTLVSAKDAEPYLTDAGATDDRFMYVHGMVGCNFGLSTCPRASAPLARVDGSDDSLIRL
jgi:hypothetical protein